MLTPDRTWGTRPGRGGPLPALPLAQAGTPDGQFASRRPPISALHGQRGSDGCGAREVHGKLVYPEGESSVTLSQKPFIPYDGGYRRVSPTP